LASIEEPAGLGEIDQLTAVLLLTVAVNACVDVGHPVLFGHRLAELGVTADTLTDELLPQAIRKPSSPTARHMPTTVEYLETFFPAKFTATKPAIGSVKGSHGRRLSARRLAPLTFGPEVVMVNVTGVDPFVPGIDVTVVPEIWKRQAVVASRPEQASVTGEPKVVAGATGATVKAYPTPETPAFTVVVVTPVLVTEKFGLMVRASIVVCDKAPDVPVMVTVAVPEVAVALAVSVSTLVVVVLVGLKAAVTPLGNPDAARATLPVKPLLGVTVTVLVPLVPTLRVRLVGESDSEKFGGGVTVKAIVVVALTLPDVPVIVTLVVPATAEALAVNVTTVVAVPFAGGVIDVGLNEAVTPAGRAEVVNVVAALKPFTLVSVMVLPTPVSVGVIDTLAGFAASVKVGGPVTVSAIVVVAVKAPDVPVIVTVAVPADAVAPAVSVSVLVVPVGFGLKAAVTPVGNPDAARVTFPVNPFAGVKGISTELP